MSRTLRISQIDINKIIYEPIRGKNKKYVPISYETPGNKLVFQTPLLYCNSKPIKADTYYELDIPLYGKSYRKVEKFVKLLKQLDMKFIHDVKTNGRKWFDGKTTIQYKSIIRDINDKGRIYENGLIKVKLLTDYNGTVVMQNGKEINPEELINNAEIRMLLEVRALWLSDTGFGLYLKPHLIDQQVIKKYQFNFVEDSDSESDILDTEIGPGNNENFDINPFIRESDTSIIPHDKKITPMNEQERELISDNNSDRIKTDANLGMSETNDESTYDTSAIQTDFNNMRKK
jgi:hypothetical protein